VALMQHPASLLEQRHGVDLPIRAGEAQPAGQQDGYRAQRQQRGRAAADYPLGRVTTRRRQPGALISQPGLPDPGPSVDHQARQLT